MNYELQKRKMERRTMAFKRRSRFKKRMYNIYIGWLFCDFRNNNTNIFICMRNIIVYIAHPVGGDVDGNLKKVAKITRDIMLGSDKAIPVAPYYLMCNALDDNNTEEREIGMDATLNYIKYAKVTQLWLYGDRISAGMKKEIELAHYLGLLVIPMTKETEKSYTALKK